MAHCYQHSFGVMFWMCAICKAPVADVLRSVNERVWICGKKDLDLWGKGAGSVDEMSDILA